MAESRLRRPGARMKIFILVVGGLITLAGLAIAVSPRTFLALFDRYKHRTGLYVLAVAIRLLLGVVLIVFAPQTGYPVTFRILGVILIAAAVGILLIGPGRLQQLIAWLIARVGKYARFAGALAVLFGVFLIAAVL